MTIIDGSAKFKLDRSFDKQSLLKGLIKHGSVQNR